MSGPVWLAGLDRVNFVYLSTVTRSAGLLIGAAFAFAWRYWRHRVDDARSAVLDVAAVASLVVLAVCFAVGEVTSLATYPWPTAVVSWTSAVAVLLTVHPRSRPHALAARRHGDVGDRSSQLWHLPLALAGVRRRRCDERIVAALDDRISDRVVLSELCYLFVELPIRRGALGASWAWRRPAILVAGAVVTSMVAVMAVGLARVGTFDVAAGGQVEQFVLAIPGQGSEQRAQNETRSRPRRAPRSPASTLLPPRRRRPRCEPWTQQRGRRRATCRALRALRPRRSPGCRDRWRSSATRRRTRSSSTCRGGIDAYFEFGDGSVNGCSVHAGRADHRSHGLQQRLRHLPGMAHPGPRTRTWRCRACCWTCS